MTPSSRLNIPGYTRAENQSPSKRLILAIDGLEKQGKTHFALTAPGPICFLDIDTGTEGVIDKFTKAKSIYTAPIEVPVKLGAVIDTDKCSEQFEKFRKAYQAAMVEKAIRTIIIDTATEVWELLRLARFGKLTQVLPFHYGPVNAEFRDLIRMAYAFDKNLILIHKLKPQYLNDKRTQNYERSGFSDTGFLVQCNTRVYRAEGEFSVYIQDCRQNPDLAGESLSGTMCTFPMLASLIFGDDLTNWG